MTLRFILGMVERVGAAEQRSRRGSGDTYSLGAVSRITGLSPHVLRAWERRYGAVDPLRTPGGTRRYRESDVRRLRLLTAAVEAGHPIGDIAQLSDSELRRRTTRFETEPRPPLRPLLEALERLEANEAERLLGLHLSALGPRHFASAVVVPLLHEVGERWSQGKLCVASEHLASAVIRNLLGSALRRSPLAAHARPLLFTTLPGDRHELGILVCALAAAELGANPVYLGPEMPAAELAVAVERAQAVVVAVGVSPFASVPERARGVRQLRRRLPREVELWVGGMGSEELEVPAGVERVAGIEELEQKIALLVLTPERPHA